MRRHRPAFTADERNAAFIDAWSIVDKLHNIRQLALAGELTFTPQLIKNFVQDTEPCTSIRNKMAHLRANIGNLAAKLKASALHAPMLGVIEFSWQREPPVFSDGRPTLDVVVLVGSSVHHSFKENIGRGLKPVTRLPCDRFILHAFGEHLSLDSCGLAAGHFCDFLAQAMEEGFTHEVEEWRAAGCDPADLTTPVLPPTTLIIRATAPHTVS